MKNTDWQEESYKNQGNTFIHKNKLSGANMVIFDKKY